MFATALNVVSPFAGEAMYETVMSSWVDGRDVGGDLSMIATLRCLLHVRNEETFHFQYFSMVSVANPEYSDTKDLFLSLTKGKTSEVEANTLYLIYLNSVDDHGLGVLCDKLESAEHNPWKPESENKVLRIKAAEEYIFNRTRNASRLYVFPKTNSAVILVRSLSMQAWHLIESFTPLYFPELFKQKPLTADERAMLECLTQRSKEGYLAAIVKLAEQYDLRESVIEANLVMFEQHNRERMLEGEKNILDEIRKKADDFAERYQSALRDLQESTIRYEGLRMMSENASRARELADYFLAHKNLKLINVDGDAIEFIVSTYLDSFDADGYDHIKANRDIYRHYAASRPFDDEENRALLMDNIFNEQPLLKIKTCAFYHINLGGRVASQSGYDYERYPEYKDCIPNPHLQYHACIGQNRTLISEQLIKSEVIGAIECCIASAMAVNIHETTQTFRPCMGALFASDRKVIYNTETKQDMTPEEALQWLKDRQAKEAC